MPSTMEFRVFHLLLANHRQGPTSSAPRGVSVRAWLLREIEQLDRKAVDALHEDQPGSSLTVRPYALAVFPDRVTNVRTSAATVRLSTLTPAAGSVFANLWSTMAEGTDTAIIDRQRLIVREISSSSPVSAIHLRAFEQLPMPIRGLRWQFMSPTAFKQTNQALSFVPTVSSLFEGLLRRFTALAGARLLESPEALAARIGASLAQTRTNTWVPDDTRHNPERGFVGECEFVVRNAKSVQPDAIAWAAMLARFAEFAGVGVETTRGMGHVRVELLV